MSITNDEDDDKSAPAPLERHTITDLIAVMAALRTPVTGCPWDLEQSFASIAPYTIEEAYEVADAIARGDLADLEEELGDLLLQVVYHSRLGEEKNAFDFRSVVDGITRKMLRRHPHVFGDAEARAAGMAKGFWERIKTEEKRDKAAARARLAPALPAPTNPAVQSVLADVPLPLPALTRAIKLQEKAARVGFDWPSLGPVLAKLHEEIAELEEVALAADPRGLTAPVTADATRAARIAEELGDLLFVVANVARHLSVDAEAALRGANAKFERRFHAIEAALAARGRAPAQSDLAEMDALWNEAKRAERK